jgi:hypothetical protein
LQPREAAKTIKRVANMLRIAIRFPFNTQN